MGPFALQGVEIEGQSSDEGLPLAGLHLRCLSLVKGYAPHQLHVEMAQAYGSLGGLTHGGEGLGEEFVHRLADIETTFELGGLIPHFLVGEPLDFRLQSVDFIDDGHKSLQFSLVGVAKTLVRIFLNMAPIDIIPQGYSQGKRRCVVNSLL